VLEEAERLNVVPRLGVRARLASQGSGKWQSSGGEKSKFGLAANQAAAGEILRERGRLDSLQLLHFHLGSQMANIRDIATGVRESARFYVELHKLGVNIQCFDVAAVWAWTMKRVRSLGELRPERIRQQHHLGDWRCL
jgi:arginine decarboxylase